jgi:hypothetical protein
MTLPALPAAQRAARRPALAGTPVISPPAVPVPPMPRTAPGRSTDRGGGPSWSTPLDVGSSAADGESLVRSVPLDEPGAWAAALVRTAVEALNGCRPVAQLSRWMTGELYDSLARRAGLAVRIKGRPSLVRHAVVRSARVCQITPLVAEAAVVVHDGFRVRAAAVRIEAHRGRWRATALEIG